MAETTGRAHRARRSTRSMNALTGKIAEMGALAERQVADAVAVADRRATSSSRRG